MTPQITRCSKANQKRAAVSGFAEYKKNSCEPNSVCLVTTNKHI